MYKLGQEIDFKKIKKEEAFDNFVNIFIFCFCLIAIILMEI